VTLQACFVAILLLLFLPLKAISVSPGLLAATPSAGTPAAESDSEGSDMSDRDEAGFHGQVKTCIEETVYPPGGKFSATTEYSLDGRLLTVRNSQGDGSESVLTYAYDGAGRSLSITSNLNSDRTDFRYDEHGGMTKILSFDPKTIERNRNAATTGSAWDAALFGMGVPTGGTVTVLHDLKSRPVEAQVRDANDDLVSRIVRRYNAEGLISEERPTLENPSALFLERMSPEERSQISPAQVQAMNKAMATMSRGQREAGKVYSYDAQGRVTQLRETNFVFEKTTTILYNDHDDAVEVYTTVADNAVVPAGVSYSFDEEGNLTPSATPERLPLPPPEEVHYSYQYDSYGNWSQQTTTRGPGPGTPVGVRHRILTYY
jgi:YD repeat-containing protein